MVYLKAKKYAPEVSSPQESRRNLLEEKEVKDQNYKKRNWRKKLGLPQEMNIYVVCRYSHIGKVFAFNIPP